MNAPDRFELFTLAEGQEKVTIITDSKMINTATFIIEKEDHTLGNMLCRKLQRDEKVLFAGYRVPHPLEHKFELKVQGDRSTTPIEAIQRSISSLMDDLSSLEEDLRAELANK